MTTTLRNLLATLASIAFIAGGLFPVLPASAGEDNDGCRGQICIIRNTETERIEYHFSFDKSRWEGAYPVVQGYGKRSGYWLYNRERQRGPNSDIRHEITLLAQFELRPVLKSFPAIGMQLETDRAAIANHIRNRPGFWYVFGNAAPDSLVYVGPMKAFSFGPLKGNGNRYRIRNTSGRSHQMATIGASDGSFLFEMVVVSKSMLETEGMAEIQDLVDSFEMIRIRRPRVASEPDPPRLTVEDLMKSLKR